MHLRHSVMVGLMGRQVDRFREYQPARPLADRLEMTARVPGVEGIEVVYPSDLAGERDAVRLVKSCGLPVSAVNLNVKSAPEWRSGSFTSPDPAVRARAVSEMRTAMDLAVEFGAGMVTCCPLMDGHDYSFQCDYGKQWDWLEEGVAEAAAHRADVRISLEYKPSESRNCCILGDMGRTLYLCERLDMPNVGVTLDVGHALVAHETPAEMVCLAHGARRLFYLHFNDNPRDWDWDMLPGSVNPWDLVETLVYLRRIGWQGWASYDVLTREGDPVEQMGATIAIMEAAQQLVESLPSAEVEQLITEGVPARAFQRLMKLLS